MSLSEEQQRAVDAVKAGKSIAIQASGGTGKSFTIDHFKTNDTIVIAPTAVAAVNVQGITCHSAFSLAHGLQTEKDLNRITPDMSMMFGEGSPVDLLVFDEAFNIRADILDAIDYKLKLMRKNNLPFGGIQVVLAGDCGQSIPIVDYRERKLFSSKYLTPFIFGSKVWKQLNPEVHVFTKIFRNANYEQQLMLSRIRMKDETLIDGKPAYKVAVDYVNSIARHGDTEDSELHLTAYRDDADKRNSLYYDAIKSKEYVYPATIEGKFNSASAMVPQDLKLKEGVRVMFVVNNRDAGYINGTTGTVYRLSQDEILVETDDGDIVNVEKHTWEDVKYGVLGKSFTKIPTGKMKQYPLMLAYSATISKVQGCTLASATMDLGKRAFGCGMLFVGLSRLTDLKNLTLTRPINYNDVVVDRKAISFIRKNEHK